MIHAIVKNNDAIAIPPGVNSIRALILDDDQFDRSKIRRMFRTSGLPFNLDEAESLESLEEILNQEEYDLVLIDYNLPQGNGIEAVKLVQNHPVNSEAATIMVTGDDQSQVAVKALKMGCQDYISKTHLSVESLKMSVEAALEGAELIRLQGDAQSTNTEQLTNQILTRYSNALQPEIAKIVREMRQLKTTFSNPDTNLPGNLEAIERRCIDLWATLRKPEEIGLSDTILERSAMNFRPI